MPVSRRPGYAPVVFDDHFWSQSLRRCEEGRDGTRLPICVKVYLPPPAGPFGMVFRIARDNVGTKLTLLAFGVRHPPRHSNAPSVYRLAHWRLNGR